MAESAARRRPSGARPQPVAAASDVEGSSSAVCTRRKLAGGIIDAPGAGMLPAPGASTVKAIFDERDTAPFSDASTGDGQRWCCFDSRTTIPDFQFPDLQPHGPGKADFALSNCQFPASSFHRSRKGTGLICSMMTLPEAFSGGSPTHQFPTTLGPCPNSHR